jgi:hypothetical protein
MNKVTFIIPLLFSFYSFGQSFAPAPGQIGSTAIHTDSSLIVNWANAIQITRGFLNSSNETLGFASYGIDSNALGKAEGDGVSVVSLGDGGVATLTFTVPITNLPGPDFAVFENGFADNYMEFAHVEVSSDGINFVRFLATSETPLSPQISNFTYGDCRFVNNLAGKYRQGYGTPFDLEELATNPNVNTAAITHVRLIDVVGSTDSTIGSTDQFGNLINDPFPTEFESGGFDLDGIAVLHELAAGNIEKKIEVKLFPNPTNGIINIHCNGEGNLRVLSLLGKVLYEEKINLEAAIDLSLFSEKIMLLEIITSGNKFVERIIVN